VKLPIVVSLCIAGSLCAPLALGAEAQDSCDDGLFLWQVDRLQDWQALRSFYNAKPACPDEDVFSLAYSDVVMRNFSEHWSELAELKKLMAVDDKFGAFVLKHVDYQGTAWQLKTTLSNATTQCPEGADKLCKDIAARVNAALVEKSMRKPSPVG
jgi:hypothetical protein